MKTSNFFHDILVWRIKHLSTDQFVLIISVILGIFAGFAAVILKSLVHFIHFSLTEGFPDTFQTYLYIAFPAVGILLTVLFVNVFLRGNLGRGVGNILYEVSKKASIVRQDKMYSHLATSSITVGCGGSVGLEAPIVVTGSALGSSLGRFFHLDAKKRTLLIGCGAAAGISAIFNAPVAGVLFALEVLLVNLSVPAFIPLLIASVTGTMISKLFLGEDLLFYFLIRDSFTLGDIPFFILLGVFTGLIALYFTRMLDKTYDLIERIKNSYNRALTGGVILGIMIFFFPPLYGEGYYAIKALLSDSPTQIFKNSMFFELNYDPMMIVIFVGSLIILKVFATALTIGAGGNGGVFAPSMFLGAFSGFFFSRTINFLNLSSPLSESNYTLVGMAGVCGAVLHAPLTCIFLIAEITSGYELFVPLMIVTAISYATISIYEPHSIYTKQLAKKGDLLRHDKDKAVLSHLKLDKMIETDLSRVPIEADLGDLVEIVATSKRNIFPVLNENEELMGIIMLDDIREIMFKPSMYKQVKARELMHAPPAKLSYYERMDVIMKKFEQTEAWNLPVLKDGKYVGFLSKSNIFSRYRRLLIKDSKD